MAHHVYTTDAYVIESLPSGEANKSYLLFTEELGMIRATAQGVRLLKSKLRFSLQDFAYSKVSIVRGKDIWRVTNAKSQSSLYEIYKDRKESLIVIAHVFSLIKRLVPGEEKNESLFHLLNSSFEFLEKNNSHLSSEELISFECILVLNILYELGYVGKIKELDSFIQAPWTRVVLDAMAPLRKIAYKEINKSLHETQL